VIHGESDIHPLVAESSVFIDIEVITAFEIWVAAGIRVVITIPADSHDVLIAGAGVISESIREIGKINAGLKCAGYGLLGIGVYQYDRIGTDTVEHAFYEDVCPIIIRVTVIQCRP